jgi:V8-like Glu-specific endopeptidase
MKLSLTTTPILYLLSAATSSINLLASAQIAPVCESFQPYSYDSGMTSSASTDVSLPSAPWIQLDLSRTELKPNAKLVLIGEKASQELDASALEGSNGYSAVFDGGSVSVELVTPGGGGGGLFRGNGNDKGSGNGNSSRASRVVVSAVKVGLCKDDGVAPAICGLDDDRIASADPRQGRIGGCTGWLISEDIFVQAGHCGTPLSSTRIHFTYGVSSAPVEDQYAVDVLTYSFLNAGVGQDWGAARLLPNSVTGKLPGVAQSEKCGTAGCGWYTLGTVPSVTTGNTIRITGYGTAAVESRSQKTHVGNLVTIGSNYLRYNPDTTGGNSGSPVIHQQTGNAIGIHTHGGCSSTGGSNQGTRIDRSDFLAHIDFLMGLSAPTRSPAPTESPIPCAGRSLKVNLLTDRYPKETSWALTNTCTSVVEQSKGVDSYLTAGTSYAETYCVPFAAYVFTISDSHGDGICCSFGSGSYSVTYGGVQVASGASFRSSESTSFGACASQPTKSPTPLPTNFPSTKPTNIPTTLPTTPQPTKSPTTRPTISPTNPPTSPPTKSPTTPPTISPTNPPTFPPTNSPTTELPLQGIGNNGSPSSVFPLGQCQGDCDNNAECQDGLNCMQRRDFEKVPGCSGELSDRSTDFCFRRPRDNYLWTTGNGGVPASAFPLSACDGDCDGDGECAVGLLCFQRDGSEAVPGCDGAGGSAQDYCYDPNNA